MSESPSPNSSSISPWWALLLLPIGLVVGHFVAELPTPAPKSTTAPAATRPSDGATAGVANGAASANPVARGVSVPGETPVVSSTDPAQPPAAEEVSEWTSLESAMAESERTGKPVMIDFNAEWCGPCQEMKQQVFDDGAHGRLVQSAVIPVSITDRVREDGQNPSEIANLQQRFKIESFPTLIVMSAKTGGYQRSAGYSDPEATVAWIQQAAKAVR